MAGHNGMVGAAICRKLLGSGLPETMLLTKNRTELDLSDQSQVNNFFGQHKIREVYLAAAKVGGIRANDQYSADFIGQNLIIQTNVISAALRNNVKKLLFLGSSCIYPKETINPIPEKSLLTGPLEPTNEAYAIAKISGIKFCEAINKQYGASEGFDYRSLMPTNLYGPNDNYDPLNSHVIPGLIRRFHQAKKQNKKTVKVWGSGSPKREFLHVDDLADACVFFNSLDKSVVCGRLERNVRLVNIGSGKEISIKDLAYLIKAIVGYSGEIEFDTSQPDGTLRKLMCNKAITDLGWRPKIQLKNGLQDTYGCFLKECSDVSE